MKIDNIDKILKVIKSIKSCVSAENKKTKLLFIQTNTNPSTFKDTKLF